MAGKTSPTRDRYPSVEGSAVADSDLIALGRQLDRLRRRAGRQWREWQRLRTSNETDQASAAGETWSATID